MAQIKRMDQIKAILRSYQSTQSLKQTARQLKISKNTVRTYVRRAQDFSTDLESIVEMSDAEIRAIIYPPEKKENQSRELIFMSQVDHWLRELRKQGVTRQQLWEEYIVEHKDGYQYSQFCERLKQAIDRKDLTMMLSHNPGEVMQVDFAGKKMNWVDYDTGEVHSCEILVCVLPFSQMAFAIALSSQKII
ncbi:MAG: transposase [Saprospiraceae bacterium]|nr:transposase [Saprospiraceae bacterium]